MAEVAITSQLEQWTFSKSIVRSDRADSAASSPELFSQAAIDMPAKADDDQALDSSDPIFQDRYLSSEEDLSPLEGDFDSDFDDDEEDDAIVEVVTATTVQKPSVSSRPKGCDLAVMVSLVSAGRPKIVNVPTAPILKDPPSRTTSLVPSLPPPIPESQMTRLSMSSSSESRPSKEDYRGRSMSLGGAKLFYHDNGSTRFSMSSSRGSSDRPFTPVAERRPSTAKSLAMAARNSLHLLASKQTLQTQPHSNYSSTPYGSTPSPSTPSFLNSDPFADGSTNSASPTIKSGSGHKRLRSISRSLAMAKIAIQKPKSSSVQAPVEPLTPFTPSAPRTPMTPENPRSSQSNRRKLVVREPTKQPPQPEPQSQVLQKHRPKLIPRGADERSSSVSIPALPVDENGEVFNPGRRATLTGSIILKSRLRKRKSLLGLT